MLATNKNERNIIKTLQMLRCIALGGGSFKSHWI